MLLRTRSLASRAFSTSRKAANAAHKKRTKIIKKSKTSADRKANTFSRSGGFSADGGRTIFDLGSLTVYNYTFRGFLAGTCLIVPFLLSTYLYPEYMINGPSLIELEPEPEEHKQRMKKLRAEARGVKKNDGLIFTDHGRLQALLGGTLLCALFVVPASVLLHRSVKTLHLLPNRLLRVTTVGPFRSRTWTVPRDLVFPSFARNGQNTDNIQWFEFVDPADPSKIVSLILDHKDNLHFQRELDGEGEHAIPVPASAIGATTRAHDSLKELLTFNRKDAGRNMPIVY